MARTMPVEVVWFGSVWYRFRMRASVCLWLLILPFIGSSQTFLNEFPLREQTRYFAFRFKGNPERVKEIARFADGFIKVVNRDFFKVEFEFPIRVLVLENRAQFKQFLIRDLNIQDPPNFGVYLPGHKLFATYEDSGLGTFTHEIMHPLVEHDLKNRPVWAMEGIPTFFEKFYGYWKENELVVFWGFQNPWRVAQIGTNLSQLDLSKIVSNRDLTTKLSSIERTESDLRMASLFLWREGRFKHFLKLITAGDKGEYKSYFEAAMGLPMKRIFPKWQDYLKEVADERKAIMSLPASTICRDENEFRKFVQSNKLSLEQPNQQSE